MAHPHFLTIRGQCLMSSGRLDEALAAHGHAARLVPDNRFYQIILELARRDVAARRAPKLPGIGMPPNPALWDYPPDVAWALWRQQQAQRQPRPLLPGGVPDPQSLIPLPGQPIGVRNPGLPQAPRTR